MRLVIGMREVIRPVRAVRGVRNVVILNRPVSEECNERGGEEGNEPREGGEQGDKTTETRGR
jgi:hypothetical protein